LPDRTFTFTGQPQTLNLTILSWEDVGGTNSTAAANVSILNTQFWMPELNRSRRIWLYLPPDYATSTKHYPVIYMKDGQNLFDAVTSFSGEWQVDETLNTLFANGDYGAIVVGIDNGGAERLNEYSPWNNPQYGGGQGALYMDFVAETLKPFIDANYRTLPQGATTALF
jgi:alpha-glucosidase